MVFFITKRSGLGIEQWVPSQGYELASFQGLYCLLCLTGKTPETNPFNLGLRVMPSGPDPAPGMLLIHVSLKTSSGCSCRHNHRYRPRAPSVAGCHFDIASCRADD